MTESFQPHVAVVVPCYNEAATIAQVVGDFRRVLPGAEIFVFDNSSSDDTARIAAGAGAHVIKVPLQGKGNVVRRMFADVDADIYVMVDGDATYDAEAAPRLIGRLVAEGLDMVVGTRASEKAEEEGQAYRFGHRFGNRMLTRCVSMLFRNTFTDMLSGYRVFSRRYAKSFPGHSAGFEIETELTVHALELRMPVGEEDTAYGARPSGSESKLRTYRDGTRILLTILKLFNAEKPLAFFSIGFALAMSLSVGLAMPLFKTYLETGLVPRLPTAMLCVALALLGGILLVCGLVLHTVTRGRREAKWLAYLSVPGIGAVKRSRSR
ncbi:glycosyltransferase family 2 protein [Cupriavidus respiraculi]|nr:glycosyltransferase family 2 protein [Cupriavidus respiraculi]MBY4949738.1 glycosyltransferase family 2 protein [Cupriavidus respiraculi]